MTINCKGNLIDLSTPKIMGILNITPNSFFDGGKYKTDQDFLKQTEKMLNEGATFIDIGAYSSKPDAEFVSEEDEIARLVPIIELLCKNFPEINISVDTFRSKVAEKSIQSGAAIVNDISGGLLDPLMFETVGRLKIPYILMHMRGNPNTMQSLTNYENLIKEMIYYFSERVFEARKNGITDIILDMGFGFAKTLEQNYEVMKNLEAFNIIDLPILVGISRKSMIYKLLDNSANEALNGTSVLNTIALQKGAKILRVHDVKEARECVEIFQAMQ